MTKDPLSNLEESLKVSQEQNRRGFAKVTERILSLSERQPFDYDPTNPLKNLKRDYFKLASLLIQANKVNGNGKIRREIKETTESLVVGAINFHLNFFRPSLLGVGEKGTFKRTISEMKRIFIAKNADYGSAFRFWGVPGLAVRIGDKYLRLTQLTRKGYRRKVKDEGVPDTALDLANYAIILLMLLDEGRSLKWGE